MVNAEQAKQWINQGLNGSDIGVSSFHVGWPSSLMPHLGLTTWLLGGAALLFFYGIKHGRIFVNPPPYFGCAVNRDPFPSRTTREYRDPRTGKHEEVTVIKKGKDGKPVEQKELRTETFWEPHGIYIGSIINWPGYYADERDWICRVGYWYDPEAGRDVRIGHRYDPETKKDVPIGPVSPGSEDQVESRVAEVPSTNNSRFPRLQKGIEVARSIGGSTNGFIAENFGYQYIGHWWFIEWAAMHDWIWWERGTDGIPFRRRNRQRYFPLTVKTSAVEMNEELIDAFGFPWSVRVSVQTKVRNIGIAVVQVPDSMAQLIGILRGNITEGWQSLKIIDYEGLKKQVKIVDGRPVPPTPAQVSEAAGQSEVKIGVDANLQELLLDYLRESGEWRRIMNQLGREVVAIIIEAKSLEGGYADAIAKVRKAELTKQEMITLSEGKEQSMTNISRGMKAQIQVVKEGGAAGIAMVESGAFNEQGNVPMDPLQKLATATLYPDVAKVQRGETKEDQNDRSQTRNEQQGQGGKNKNRNRR